MAVPPQGESLKRRSANHRQHCSVWDPKTGMQPVMCPGRQGYITASTCAWGPWHATCCTVLYPLALLLMCLPSEGLSKVSLHCAIVADVVQFVLFYYPSQIWQVSHYWLPQVNLDKFTAVTRLHTIRTYSKSLCIDLTTHSLSFFSSLETHCNPARTWALNRGLPHPSGPVPLRVLCFFE